MPSKRTAVTVRPSAPGRFAVVGADGGVIRDDFTNRQTAWMWCGKQRLHIGRDKRKGEARAIPNSLIDDQILGLPLLARMSNLSYGVFLSRAHNGEFGALIKVNERAFGLRYGGWKAAMTAREVVK